jgi:hypothetical protein
MRIIPTTEALQLSTQLSSRSRSGRAAASPWAVSAAGDITLSRPHGGSSGPHAPAGPASRAAGGARHHRCAAARSASPA